MSKKKSIRKRIMIQFGGLILAAFIVVLLISRLVLQFFVTTQMQKDFSEEMTIINAVYREEILNTESPKELRSIAESIRSSKKRVNLFKLDTRVEFITVINGNIRLVTTESLLTDVELDVIKDLIENNDFNSIKTVDIKENGDTKEYRVFISPLKINENSQETESRVYAVLYTSIEDELLLVQRFTRILFLILAVVYLFTLLVMYILAQRLIKPIKQLQIYAKALGKNERVDKVPIKTKDEIWELSETMDQMADDIRMSKEEQVRFLQNVSHELKTPLMSIRGYAEGVIDGVMEDDNDALNTIIEESDRMKGIVTQLSYLSKLETGAKTLKYEELSINRIIEESIKKMKPIAEGKGIIVNFNTRAEDDLKVKGDNEALIQVMINLLSNGIRYANEKVILEVYKVDDLVKVKVTDDGLGIKEKSIPHLFERFYKGKNGQTGLGLAIVKAIIDQHNGRVIGFNSDDLGACFEIVLKCY